VAIVALAIAFILKYVFHYYLHYDAAAFDGYWPRRAGLLLHMVALLTGPWQFFTGLTGKRMTCTATPGAFFSVA
jgi:hypothetical protein